MEAIRSYFETAFGIKMNADDWHFFSSKLSKSQFPPKHVLLECGQVEDCLSFMASGIVRFYIPGEEYDLTFSFAFEHSFVSGYDSFLTRTPSYYRIETLKKTSLWQLSYQDLQSIYKNTDIGDTVGRKAGEDLFIKKSRRELSLLNESAEERYLNLFTEQPHLIKEIPLKYIASYIGITPQALSRIRRRIIS